MMMSEWCEEVVLNVEGPSDLSHYNHCTVLENSNERCCADKYPYLKLQTFQAGCGYLCASTFLITSVCLISVSLLTFAWPFIYPSNVPRLSVVFLGLIYLSIYPFQYVSLHNCPKTSYLFLKHWWTFVVILSCCQGYSATPQHSHVVYWKTHRHFFSSKRCSCIHLSVS